MNTSHPSLLKNIIEQTPRSMFAMLIVSSVYCLVFYPFIPTIQLFIWLFFQVVLAKGRLFNVKQFTKHLEFEDSNSLSKDKLNFIALNLFQAFMWTTASVLVMIYAPSPAEFVMVVVTIGIITAATLSMSSYYKAYLIFFTAMITPQIIILIYYGEHLHIALILFILIYIPATFILSKSMSNSAIASIEAHEELEKKSEEFRKLSIMDNLTNIYNRRYFFEISKEIFFVAFREKSNVSLLMIDVDFFKKVNDNYGHHVGDFILINMVKEIKKTLRKSDIFARVGGEEFAILLNNTSIKDAKIIAEKIRWIIENKIFMYKQNSIKITISIGIAELIEENTLIDSLYKQADKQLYIAKKQGRNRVMP